MQSLHVVQHVPFEGPGAIASWAEGNGYAVRYYPIYEGSSCPSPEEGDLLCLMGGPMNIYEDATHSWLATERAWLRKMIAAGHPIVGVCLGAQLLADALGSRVYPHHTKEIGWMPVSWNRQARGYLSNLPEETTVLHWHGDTFDLPGGALPLASSAYCPNQGFLHGRCLAFQFHLEAGEKETALMLENCANELRTGSESIHTAEAIRAGVASHQGNAVAVLHQWLDFWAKA